MRRCVFGLLVLLFGAGCGKPPAGAGDGGTAPAATDGAPAASPAGSPGGGISFWHTQTKENETALKAIIADFNALDPSQPPIEAVLIGDYNQLYEKIRASAADAGSGALPALAVAYESMIADYMQADIVRPLDDLLADPEVGIAGDDLADIYPAFLERNRFAQFGGKLLSFPFTTSLLLLYYNQTMLEGVGAAPPETWDQFLAVCRKIKAKYNIAPVVTAVDASTLDGVIMSFGGTLLKPDGSAGFDSPQTAKAFAMLNSLHREGLAYQVQERGDVNNEFANQKCAFFFRSSTARPFIDELVGDKFQWSMAALPAAAGVKPLTVLFGANICVLKSTPERERRAWEFIRYFSSTAVTSRWAQATGYLPMRASASDTPDLKAFLAAAPQNRVAYDLIPIGRVEPSAAGWQDVRECLETAETAIINQVGEVADVVTTLDGCADTALAEAKP